MRGIVVFKQTPARLAAGCLLSCSWRQMSNPHHFPPFKQNNVLWDLHNIGVVGFNMSRGTHLSQVSFSKDVTKQLIQEASCRIPELLYQAHGRAAALLWALHPLENCGWVGLASSQSTGGLWMVRLPAEKAVVDWGCATQVCELPSVSCEEEQSEEEC